MEHAGSVVALVLMILALVCFILQSIGLSIGKFSPGWLGLVLWAFVVLLGTGGVVGLVLMIFAVICLALQFFGIGLGNPPVARYQLGWLGLALWILSLIVK